MTGEQIIAELGNFDGAAEILQAWRDGMAPEPALLVSDWPTSTACSALGIPRSPVPTEPPAPLIFARLWMRSRRCIPRGG